MSHKSKEQQILLREFSSFVLFLFYQINLQINTKNQIVIS